jgi:prefoldin subunit 5
MERGFAPLGDPAMRRQLERLQEQMDSLQRRLDRLEKSH